MISCTLSVSAVVAITLLLFTHSVAVVDQNQKCDLYQGRWVFDKSYPLYRSQQCPFIIQQFNCPANGRPDFQYQKYRWQPNNCDLPRYGKHYGGCMYRWDGREFARRARGKRIMFVGDSLSMNQWQSLACMIHAAYPRAPYQPVKRTGPLSTIVFPQLNLTLMYLRNAFIVDIAIEGEHKVLKLDNVASSAKLWLQSNILVFDTWHWWLYTGRKQPWNLIRTGNVTMKNMDRLDAYEKALRSWGKWVDRYVDTRKVKIFFQGVSPDHWNASDWGMPEMQRCGRQPYPLKQPTEEGDTNTANIILKNVLTSMKKSVHLLDINRLSQFRVDGHPSVYGNPRHIGMDCTHWCLPGVPDAWNQFLYAALLTL